MKKLNLLRYYIYIWVSYFAVVLVLPATRINGELALSYFLLLSFVIVSSIIYVVSLSFLELKSPRKIQHISNIDQLVNYAAVMAIISVICITYDRVYFQGIDYLKGVAFAREELRNAAVNKVGFSSIFSFIGNLFSGYPIVLIALTLYHYETIKSSKRILLLLVSFITFSSLVVLSGGRSIIMMYVLTCFIIGVLRKSRDMTFMPMGSSGRGGKVFWILFFCVCVVYSVYVFHLRAIMSGSTSTLYLIAILDHLGGSPYDWMNIESTTLFGAIIDYLTIAGAYLVHGTWTFQSILELDTYPGTVMFAFYRINLARITGNDAILDEGVISGVSSTLPGAIYYDMGFGGLIIGAFVIGIFIFVATLISRLKRLTPLSFGIFLSLMYVVLLSPLVLAVDVMSFPFIFFDFIFLHILWLFSRLKFFKHFKGDK